MKKRPVQYLPKTGESLLSTEQIITFLEDFRAVVTESKEQKTILISLKISQSLLYAFKLKATSQGARYQTQIKKLMLDWLKQDL